MGFSAAADGHDDFQAVAVLEPGFGMPAARHHLAVVFDGDALTGVAESFEEFRQTERRIGKDAFLAVYGKDEHGRRAKNGKNAEARVYSRIAAL